jgi:hypothetical protein
MSQVHMDPSPPKEHATSVPPQSAPQSRDGDSNDASNIVFNPGARFYFAFSSLTVLAMMVALDGTSVSVALPVSTSPYAQNSFMTKNTDHRK